MLPLRKAFIFTGARKGIDATIKANPSIGGKYNITNLNKIHAIKKIALQTR